MALNLKNVGSDLKSDGGEWRECRKINIPREAIFLWRRLGTQFSAETATKVVRELGVPAHQSNL